MKAEAANYHWAPQFRYPKSNRQKASLRDLFNLVVSTETKKHVLTFKT